MGGGGSNKGLNFEVGHDEVMISTVEKVGRGVADVMKHLRV